MKEIKYINYFAKDINSKIADWDLINLEFRDSIYNPNVNKLREVLEKGYPFVPSEKISEEEILAFGHNDYENFTDDYYEHTIAILNELYCDETKTPLWELISEYLMFQRNEFASSARMLYFTYTKNYSQALKYVDQLVNSFGFLCSEVNMWIKGALYNDNTEFYDSLYIVCSPKFNDGSHKYTNILCGSIISSGKYYNIESWKNYYSTNHEKLLNEFYFSERNENIDLYSAVTLKLLDYPLSIINNESRRPRASPDTIEKYSQKKMKVQPIVAFLLDEYCSFTEVDKLELMLVGLYHERERDLLERVNNKDIKNVSNRTGLYSHRALAFGDTLLKTQDKLQSYINKAISLYDPYECIDAFDACGISRERYQALAEFIELSNIPEKAAFIGNKKTNKI